MNMDAIEKAIAAKLQELHIPGGSAVIVKDDQVVFRKAFGLRDVERHLPVTLYTLFPIRSCTKSFTAMAAAMSQDAGTLALDDSPRRYLPYFQLHDPEANAQTTIRDLLCHRTGLMGMDVPVVADSNHVLSREDLLHAAGSAKPTARFREKFQYSNVLFAAAGDAVANADHQPWEQVMSERIFKPLVMTSSLTSKQAMEQFGNYTQGYEYDDATGQHQKRQFPDWIPLVAPGGAIMSNIRDMTQWLRLMLGGGVFEGKRLVSEKGFQELITPHLLQSNRADEKYAICLGWYTVDWNGFRVVQANGSTAGFFASISFMPDERIGMVILSQLGTGQCDPVFFWPLILGKPEPPAASETTSGAPVSASPPLGEAGYRGPLSADALIARMIAALGGESNLRKHTSMVVRFRRVYENLGMVSEETLLTVRLMDKSTRSKRPSEMDWANRASRSKRYSSTCLLLKMRFNHGTEGANAGCARNRFCLPIPPRKCKKGRDANAENPQIGG